MPHSALDSRAQEDKPMKRALPILVTNHRGRQGLWFLPLLIAAAIGVVLAVRTDQFLSTENLFNLVAQTIPLVITAIGQMFVVVVGGLDLSVGSVVSFTTAILALGGPAYLLIPAVLLLAVLIGLVNGFAIIRLNVHPIIATLAMQYIVLGITRILRPVSGGTVPDVVIASVAGSFMGVPMPVFWGIVVILLAWKLLHGSRFGLHLFAIGGGVAAGMEDAARNFGIAARRNIMLAYVASSCFAALAGVFLAGRIVSGDPNVGLLFELDAITAVAIGGTQLSGGIGSLHGTVIGALILALLSNGMNLTNVSPFIQTAIKGGILLLVVGLQSRKKMGL
jgi:ribose transport system permease protein